VKKIFITCGETSSELIAARLVEFLLKARPGMEVLALGSRNLEEAGARVVFRMEDYSVMGFWEVFKRLPRFLAVERSLKSILSSGDIGLYIPVDFPGLNLRLSGFAKRLGIPVLYFISPQVWAWGGWRLKKIKKVVDLMAVLFPFEEQLYRNEGIDVILVRHPLLDMVKKLEHPKEAPSRGDRIKIVIFPGSREQEVSRMLPVLLEAAALIRKKFRNADFVIGLAPLIDESSLDIPSDMQGFVRVSREGLEELNDASLVLASSGTVTLQSAMSGTPTIVIYKTSQLTYLLGKLLVKVPIQGEAEPERIAGEAVRLLTDPEEYRRLSARLLELGSKLQSEHDVSDLARIALKMIS